MPFSRPIALRPVVWSAIFAFCILVWIGAKETFIERLFVVRPPRFVTNGAIAVTGSQFGPIQVTREGRYLVEIEGVTNEDFDLRLAYSDGTQSRSFRLDRRELVSGARFLFTLRADRSDRAAKLAFTGRGIAGKLQLHRLQVSQFIAHYPLWRLFIRILRSLAGATLLVGLCWRLIRGLSRHWQSAKPRGALSVSPTVHPSVRHWAIALAAMAVCFSGALIKHRFSPLYREPRHPAISGFDDSYYFFWLRSVMVDGDVSFANDLLYCDTMPATKRAKILDNPERTKTGLLPNKYPIGWALLGVPWYCAAELMASAANLLGFDIPRDGWHPLYQTWLVIGQLVYAAAGLYLAFRIVSFYLPAGIALCGVALTWIASSLFYYQVDQVSMAHNVMFFAATGAYFFSLKLRAAPGLYRYWALTGLFCALVILSRYQGGVLLLFPGVVCLQAFFQDFRRFGHLCAAIAAGAMPLSLQLLAWHAVYGSFFVYSYSGEGFSWFAPEFSKVLFSPFHGLFNWHPVMLVGFLGFAAWAWRNRWRTDAGCFAGSLAFVTYVNAAWYCWWFGASFGSRAFETCTLYAMIGVSFLLSLAARCRFLFPVAAAIILALGIWNVNLAWMVEHGRLPLETPLTWADRWKIVETFWRDG